MIDLDHAKDLIEAKLPGVIASVYWDKLNNVKILKAFVRERSGARASLLHTPDFPKTAREIADKIVAMWDHTWLDEQEMKR